MNHGLILEKMRIELDEIARAKRKVEDGNLGIRVGKVINKYKVGKFVLSTITDGVFSWSFDEEKIREEEQFDGCYVIFTNVPKEEMEIDEVVKNYRKLIHVEQAFRNLKTVQLQIRPVYHKTDDRVDCHVFLCMLSYYLMWNMKQRLKPLMDNDVREKIKNTPLNTSSRSSNRSAKKLSISAEWRVKSSPSSVKSRERSQTSWISSFNYTSEIEKVPPSKRHQCSLSFFFWKKRIERFDNRKDNKMINDKQFEDAFTAACGWFFPDTVRSNQSLGRK